MEIWRPVAGRDRYEVSSLGRVRSWCKREGIEGRLDKPLIKSQRIHRDGYSTVKLCMPHGKVDRLVHQLVLETFVGPCPKNMETRHLDGNPANNRLENLKWGTLLENVADAVRHGTRPRRKTLASKG